MSSKNFTFTYNNYPDTSLIDGLECRYVIYGKEVGESGTPHLQGFVCFEALKRMAGVIKLLPGCHVEIARNAAAAIQYCKKDREFTERGLIPMSQKRKGEMESERWELAYDAAKDGRFEDIPKDILIKHLGNLKKIRAEFQVVLPTKDGELQHQWIWGAAGTGKTSKAMSENPRAYLKGLNKWWDGYVDQEVVIIDDMDPFHKSMARDFKIWADRYPFPAEVKGGSIVIRPSKIVVTSNYRIHEVWDDEVTLAAMNRRFTEIYIPSNLPMSDYKTVI